MLRPTECVLGCLELIILFEATFSHVSLSLSLSLSHTHTHTHTLFKTTLAKGLFDKLGGDSNPSLLMISYDSYYRCQSDKPIEERAKTNFDHPDSLETELLIQNLRDLKLGKSVDIPHYDFATHTRVPDAVTKIEQGRFNGDASTGENQRSIKIIILEGILVLTNEELMSEMDIKVYVDADADIRFIRRMARDTVERGRTVEDVMHQYQTTVRPMHEEWVEPSKHHANIVVYSTTQSLDVATEMLCNHLRVESGML